MKLDDAYQIKHTAAMDLSTRAELAHIHAMRSDQLQVVSRARELCSDAAVALVEAKMGARAATLTKKLKQLDKRILELMRVPKGG